MDLLQLTGLGLVGADGCPFYSGYRASSRIRQRQSGAQKQWNLVDAFGVFLGHHQFKFGVDYRRLAPFAIAIDYPLLRITISVSLQSKRILALHPLSLMLPPILCTRTSRPLLRTNGECRSV